MSQKACGIVNKICICLTCGGCQYIVRLVHTLLCIAIPSTLIYNSHCDLHTWLVRHQGSYIYGILYVGLLIASLIFYYAACLTDPGYVDEKTLVHLANDEEEEEELFVQRGGARHDYTPIPSAEPTNQITENISNHNSSIRSDHPITAARQMEEGGITQRREDNSLHEYTSTDQREDNSSSSNLLIDSNKTDEFSRMCKVCNIMQPLRSRHCEDCKRCVLRFDHHCPWLSTCVGEKNHKFFWLFLLFINIVIIFSIILAVRGFPAHNPGDKEFPPSDVALVLLTIVDCFILAVGGLSTLSLFGFHSYLMITNQTTWESVSRQRISYLKKLRDDYNPFHQGYCHNIYTFCCKMRPNKWRAVYSKSTSTALLSQPL